MNRFRTFALATLALLGLSLTTAHAGVFVGIGIPGPYYRPYPRYYYPYYGPRVIVAAPPVVYVNPAPAPVYVTPAPVYVSPPPTPAYYPPAPAPDRWFLMRELQGTYPGWLLDGNRIQVYGWTDTSFTASSASPFTRA